MPAVLLVRHGRASFGAADYDSLSDLGHRQAEVLASTLADRGIRIDRLESGTLRRQRETAAALLGHDAAIDPRWDEYDPDDILANHSDSAVRLGTVGRETSSGRPDNRGFQATLDPALSDWIEVGTASRAAQTWPDFRAAGQGALTNLAAGLGSGGTGVAVTSGGVIAALVGSILGVPAEVFGALNRVVVNASITKLVIGASGTNVVSFNDHSHLEMVGPERITYR